MRINTSAFVELHTHGEPLALNVNLIESIRSHGHGGQATIYMAGSEPGSYWLVDESYGQVIEKIKEL